MKNYLKENRLSMYSIEQCIEKLATKDITVDAAKDVINSTIAMIVNRERYSRVDINKALESIERAKKQLEG